MVLSHLFPITQWLVIPTINSIPGFFEKHCFSLSRVSSNSGLSGNIFNQFMEFKTKLAITDYLQSMQLTKTAENLQPACSTAVFAFPSFVLSCSKTTKKSTLIVNYFSGRRVIYHTRSFFHYASICLLLQFTATLKKSFH